MKKTNLMELVTDTGEKDKMLANFHKVINEMIAEDDKARRVQLGVNLIGLLRNILLRQILKRN